MGVTDRVSQFVTSVQVGAKNASQSMLTLALKLISVFIIGLTLAMIGQELIGYGTIGFVFMLLFSGAVLLRILLNWSLGATLVFDLVALLVGLLLRMYILIAP